MVFISCLLLLTIVVVKKILNGYSRVMANRATFQLGYLMGLIAGEGSFTTGPRLSMTLHVNDPQPLLDLRARFGGTIYGPYTTHQANGATSAVCQWVLRGRALWEALPILTRHLPPSHKKDQYTAWMLKHAVVFMAYADQSSDTVIVDQRLSRRHPLPDAAARARLRQARRARRKETP